MKNLMSPKLVLMATLLTSSLSMADGLPKLQSKEQSDKVFNQIISSVLSEIGAIRKLNFKLKTDSRLSGIPVESGSVDVSINMIGQVIVEVITNTGKPNLTIGKAGLLLNIKGDLIRDENSVEMNGDVSFAGGVRNALPADLGIAKVPTLRTELYSLHIESKSEIDIETVLKVAPLGNEVTGSCKAGIAVTDNKGQSQFQKLNVCTFKATFNQETQKYDVDGTFESSGN